jgi:hypothetical protein
MRRPAKAGAHQIAAPAALGKPQPYVSYCETGARRPLY